MGELNMQELETAYDAAAEFIHDESLVSRARMRGAIRMIIKAKNAAQDEHDRIKASHAGLVALLKDALPHVEKMANALATGPVAGPVEHLADDIQTVLAKAKAEAA